MLSPSSVTWFCRLSPLCLALFGLGLWAQWGTLKPILFHPFNTADLALQARMMVGEDLGKAATICLGDLRNISRNQTAVSTLRGLLNMADTDYYLC